MTEVHAALLTLCRQRIIWPCSHIFFVHENASSFKQKSLGTYGKEVGVEQAWRRRDLLSAAHSSPGGLSSETEGGDRSESYLGGKVDSSWFQGFQLGWC